MISPQPNMPFFINNTGVEICLYPEGHNGTELTATAGKRDRAAAQQAPSAIRKSISNSTGFGGERRLSRLIFWVLRLAISAPFGLAALCRGRAENVKQKPHDWCGGPLDRSGHEQPTSPISVRSMISPIAEIEFGPHPDTPTAKTTRD